MQTQVDPRIRAIWDLHLAMEIECKDAVDILGLGYDNAMTFVENKEYLKRVVADQVDLTA